ncbi:MAG: hypothetical protein ABR549_08975 [Mycobacteriales bacterium]
MRAALAACLLAAACSGGSVAPEVIPSASPEPHVLPAGTSGLALAPGTYYSPVDFVPPLALGVPAGWSSARRGDDAFDLSRPGLVVVFDTPDGETVRPVLHRLRTTAPKAVSVTSTLLGQPATGFDASGGSGELLRSPSGTIALDYAAGQQVRVLGADVDGVPLLAVVLVLDGKQWNALLPQAMALLGAVTPG